MTDSISKAAGVNLSDTVLLTDSISKDAGVNLSESISLTDEATTAASSTQAITESITFTDDGTTTSRTIQTITETTDDITERSDGATHECVRTSGPCPWDPRTDWWSDGDYGAGNDDVVYWDQHEYQSEFEIYDNINADRNGEPILTEEQMHAGFTLNSAIEVRDRGLIGGDPFWVKITVTDGTPGNTYTSSQTFYMAAGSEYETVTSSLIVTAAQGQALDYEDATFRLNLLGDCLAPCYTSGSGYYSGPQTRDIELTVTAISGTSTTQTISESISFTDSITYVSKDQIALSESVSLTDSTSTGGTANLSESVSLTDSTSTGGTANLSESVSLTDSTSTGAVSYTHLTLPTNREV